MTEILLNAFGLFLIILVGYAIKSWGLVKQADGRVLSTIIVTITLPATVIVGLNEMAINADFLVLAGLALVFNIVLVLFAGFITRRKSYHERVLLMYSISGYNIGNFTLPFMQSFFPLAIPYLFMFDVGNCVMIAGGSKVFVERTNPEAQEANPWQMIRRSLFSSIPFLTYIFMVVLRTFNLAFPPQIINLSELFARGNGFLSLLMIGIYLELRLPKADRLVVLKVLLWRYGIALLLAMTIYFLVPMSNHLMKVVLTLVCLAPIPTFAVIHSVEAGVKEEVVGFLSSISILISLVMLTAMVLIIG